jgi:hypothetical protein
MFGLNLHGWENAMVFSLAIAAIAAAFVGISTYVVVLLQREALKDNSEEFEKYKTEAGTKISEATARAAEANARAEELKAQLAWRELTFTQLSQIATVLRGHVRKVVFSWFSGDPEATEYAGQIASAMKSAGIEVTDRQIVGGSVMPSGLIVHGTEGPEADALINGLRSAGLAVEVGHRQSELELFVGTKPRAKSR